MKISEMIGRRVIAIEPTIIGCDVVRFEGGWGLPVWDGTWENTKAYHVAIGLELGATLMAVESAVDRNGRAYWKLTF